MVARLAKFVRDIKSPEMRKGDTGISSKNKDPEAEIIEQTRVKPLLIVSNHSQEKEKLKLLLDMAYLKIKDLEKKNTELLMSKQEQANVFNLVYISLTYPEIRRRDS